MEEGVEREHISRTHEQQQQQQSHQHIISLSSMNTLENSNDKNDITGVQSGHAKSELKTNIAATGDSS